MSLLNVGGLTKYYGAQFIFDDIGFQISRGDKVALVGTNGAGKSTLLKIIAGIENPTRGGVHLARGTRIAYLAQEARFSGERTLWQEMEAALDYLMSLRDELTSLEHALADTSAPDWEQRMERYGELSQRFEHGGGYEIERRIELTLRGLGFSDAQFHQQVAQFSGGQKTRAALAAALLSDPDLLLLDEPTNHLDLAALEWLERFLKMWDGTLMVISHDRYFLDKVTTRTLEIAFGRLDGDYPAGYHKYLELKAARLELQLKQFKAQQEQIAKTEEFIRRFKNSQLSSQARGRERRLQRLKEGWEDGSGRVHRLIDRPDQQKKLALNLGTELRSGERVLRLDKLVVGFLATEDGRRETEAALNSASSSVPRPPSTVLIKCPNLEISRGQRVALIGPNGSGKTTLLRTIVGEQEALRGEARLGYNVVMNYYAQSHEGLNLENTVLDEIRRASPGIKETPARTLLGRFLFSGDDVYKRVGDLSGGERSRVALAQLTLMGGNLLVLDEPTNHLDIDAREALEGVLNEYKGTILFVSHDRYFIDAVADTVWAVEGGSITAFDGNYSEYMAEQEQSGVRGQGSGARNGDTGSVKQEATDERREAPFASNGARNGHAPSKEDRKKQRKLASLEEEIAALEQNLKQLEEQMSQAGLKGDAGKVTSLGSQYAEVQERLGARYDEWAATAG